MKRFFLILILIISGLSSYAVITRETKEVFTPIFISRFLKCIPCKMEQNIVTEDGTIKIQRFLRNWKEHKCRYSEIRIEKDKKVEFSCNLSRSQVNSLTNAMKQDPMGEGVAKQAWESLIKDINTCQKVE